MAQLERLRIFPVKGLDGIDVERSTVLSGGTLACDREFALFDTNNEVINGKRTDRIHDLATDFDPASGTLIVKTPDGENHDFNLERERERERAGGWFGDLFGIELTLQQSTSLGFVDRRGMGPSVISTATIETLASWFEELTVEGARRRLRANVEIGGVPAFWEDRFIDSDTQAFEVGGVRFKGVTPCGRCVVPGRDPDTGEMIDGFRERFIQKRRESVPDWTDVGAFDHWYSLMIITRVPEVDREQTLCVGDPVSVPD